MRKYYPTDEEKIRMQGLVREWERSSLIEESQVRRLQNELQVSLKNTNSFLRALLFLFTLLIVAASFAFIVMTLHFNDDLALTAACLFAAPLCFGIAEFLIAKFHLYRFGIEEACAVSAVIFIAAGLKFSMSDDGMVCAVAGLAALGIFLRFGYVYAAMGGIGCAAAIPFQFGLSGPQERLLAASMLAGGLG